MTTATPEKAAGAYTLLGPTRSGAASRARSILPWVAVVLLGALALVAMGLRDTPDPRLLDPRSPAGVGSRALAEVLGDRGVEVDVATSIAELPSTFSPGTTVVVTADDRLSPGALTDVARRAVAADRLVVLLVEPETVGHLAPGLSGYGIPSSIEVTSAPSSSCTIPALRPGDTVRGGLVSIQADDTAEADGVELCLPPRYLDAHGMLAHLPGDDISPETFLVGFGSALTNAEITAEDNAAIALRLLGHSPQLVWLIPSGADGPDGMAGDTYSPWPTWTTPVTVVLAIGTALLALVRGRRLGRLVTEPLPVTVRAAETTESRGHLYRRSRDLGRAARILREGSRSRLRRRLGVARTDSLDTLVTAVAVATREPQQRVQALLTDSEPVRSADLVRLGSDLEDLERKVRLT